MPTHISSLLILGFTVFAAVLGPTKGQAAPAERQTPAISSTQTTPPALDDDWWKDQ
jgi:hypothetical protein